MSTGSSHRHRLAAVGLVALAVAVLAGLYLSSRSEHLANVADKTASSSPTTDLSGKATSRPSTSSAVPEVPFEKRLENAQARFLDLLERNPADAAVFAAAQTDAEIQREALNQAIIAWADTDPQAAWDWTNTALPEGPTRTAVQTTLAYQIVPKDPKLALSQAAALPQSRERDQLLDHAAMQWSLTEPDEAIAWADQIPDEKLNSGIIAAIATAVATQHPREAAELAVSLPPGPEQDRAAVAVAQRWAQQDYPAAHAWASSFSDPLLRQAALEALAPLTPPK